MTRHDDFIRLRHMLDHSREAMAMIQGLTIEDFQRQRMLQLALVRLVEIVGEAASKVTEESRGKYPSIPWQQARGMRNRLVHGYDQVDLTVLWDTIATDLPPLADELEKILGEAGA